MNKITLTKNELQMAATIGAARNIESRCSGIKDTNGYDGDGWGINIEGAAGEIAVAKFLGRYWNGSVGTYKKGGDVGDIQVRTNIITKQKTEYPLMVRPYDRDEDIFILVVGKTPEFKVIGWIRGKDAKQEKWLIGYGPRPKAYFVPQENLKLLKQNEM